MEGAERSLLSLTILIFISVATFETNVATQSEELGSRIEHETELDDTEIIQHAFDINSVEPSGKLKDDPLSSKQSHLSSPDEKQQPADSQHVHQTVVTETSPDLELDTVDGPHTADKPTNAEHRPAESNPSNVVPTNSGTVDPLAAHLLANLYAHRPEQSKKVDNKASQFAQQSDQPTKQQVQGTQPVIQTSQAAGQPTKQASQAAGQPTKQASQGTEHPETQTSELMGQLTGQAFKPTKHTTDQLSTGQYSAAQQTLGTGQPSEQPAEVSGRPKIQLTIQVTSPSQIAQSAQATKEHVAQLGIDQPSEYSVAQKETVEVSVMEAKLVQSRDTADSSPQHQISLQANESAKTTSVEESLSEHIADHSDTSVPAADDEAGNVHDTAEQNYTVDLVEITEEDLAPQSLEAEKSTVVEDSNDNIEAESHEVEMDTNYGVKMEDADKKVKDVAVGDDLYGDTRLVEARRSREGDKGVENDNSDHRQIETQPNKEVGDVGVGDHRQVETQGSKEEGVEDVGYDVNIDNGPVETQGNREKGDDGVGDDISDHMQVETQGYKEEGVEGVGDDVNIDSRPVEAQGDTEKGDEGVGEDNSDTRQVTTLGGTEEDDDVEDDVNTDTRQIQTHGSNLKEDEGLGDWIDDEMLGKNPDLTSEQTKSDKVSLYGQFVAYVDVLLTMLDDGLDGAIHEMPPPLQRLFTNAPLALSPPRCLLVFIATCTGLFFLITISCVQLCRLQRSSTKNIDLCEHLFTVENSLLVAEQENEDLHEEVDALKARVREFEIRSNLSSSETDDLIAERDRLKAEIISKTNLITLMETTLSSQDSELRSCTNENKTLKQKFKEVTEHCEVIESRLLESQATLQHSQTSALEMQSQLQSMTDEISLLQSCKDRLLAESEGCNEKMQDMSDQISKLLEEQKVYQQSLALKDKKLDELCQCFAQLKSFEVEILSKSAMKQDQRNRIGAAESVTDGTVAAEDASIDSVDAANSEPTEQDDELHLNQQMKNALQEKLHSMMDVASVTAKLKTVENECLSLQNVVSSEVKGRLEMEERLKVAQAEIAQLTESRQEAELEANAVKVRMDVISGLRSEKDREYLNVCSKMAEYESHLKDYAHQLAASDSRFKENESVNQSLREQIDKYQQEIQKLETEYGRLIAAQEKKAHENWLAARQSERLWKEEKTESQSLRQKLLELQTKLDILSQEPPIVPPTSAAENVVLDESGSSLSSVPPGMPADRRSIGFPLHDGYMMRPPPPPLPPFFRGPMLPVGDRSLPPHLRDMRHTPPIPSSMFDMRMRNPLPIPLPFDMFRGPPLYPSRSPSSPDDRGSPRDFDRSPSSIHSPIPARGSSPTLSRNRASPPSYHRGRPSSPPQLVDRGPCHVARPRPELGAPLPGTRGSARNPFPPRNDSDPYVFMSSSPS